MKNPLLNAAIMRTLSRLDPVPVRKDTLAAEIDIALAEPVTTLAFDAALADLRQGGFVAVRRDRLLGQLPAAVSLQRADRDDRAAQRLREARQLDLVAILLHQVHHNMLFSRSHF